MPSLLRMLHCSSVSSYSNLTCNILPAYLFQSKTLSIICNTRYFSDNTRATKDDSLRDHDIEQFKHDTLQFLSRLDDPSKLDTRYMQQREIKKKKDGDSDRHFKDHAVVKVKGGNGGDGCFSLRSAYKNEYAGPDGGDGGTGGHVLFKASSRKNSLGHLPPVIRAKDGEVGRKNEQFGANAENVVIEVPLGTMFKFDGKDVGSLDVEHAQYLAARGGAGGKGNMYFATSTDKTPKVAEVGGKGEEFCYQVELRTMADIGLIGFPNAGKSTLLRAVSRARPKVASFPFTTRKPFVGIVTYADMEQLAVADIPGLIEKAHLNRGLGHDFLRHVQRCSGLLYVLDASLPKPWEHLEVLRNELEMFQSGLSTRPHAIIANKMDLPEAQENFAELQRNVDLPVIALSAHKGTNVSRLVALMRWLTERSKLKKSESEEAAAF